MSVQLWRPARRVLYGLQVIAALALAALIAVLLAGTLPSLLGYESFVVYSGSMEPAIRVGDLAVVGPAKAEELMVGDIISYRISERPEVVVTHRLVNIGLDEQGGFVFQTKGDANPSVDAVKVSNRAVLGRVAYGIPKLGYLVEFSRRSEGKLLLIGIPGLLLALDYLLGGRRRRWGDTGAALGVVRDAPPRAKRAEVTPAQSIASNLVARGRVALANGAPNVAMALCDDAIAADAHLDDAWLLKAECIADVRERLACLRAGLTVNPTSERLKRAIEAVVASEAATG